MVNQTCKNLRYYIGHNKDDVYRVHFEPLLRLLDKTASIMEEKVIVFEGKSTNCKNFKNFKVYFSLKSITYTKLNKKEVNSILCRFISNGNTKK